MSEISKKDKIKELITSLSEANIRLAFELMDGQDISDKDKLQICKDAFLKMCEKKLCSKYNKFQPMKNEDKKNKDQQDLADRQKQQEQEVKKLLDKYKHKKK